MAGLEWFEAVLVDLEMYAKLNNLKDLEASLAQARMLAASEIAELDDRFLNMTESLPGHKN